MTHCYIDAARVKDKICVSWRDSTGRHVSTHSIPYTFYYADPQGSYVSMTGVKVKRFRTSDRTDFERELAEKRVEFECFETNVPEIYRLLEQQYSDQPPELRIGFFDIEVDKDPEQGWAKPNNPYAPITAVTLHDKHERTTITLLVPPSNLSREEAQDLLDGIVHQRPDGTVAEGDPDDSFPSLRQDQGFFLCRDEAELLQIFLELIEPIDVLSGYNSTFYDLPYLCARIRIVLGRELLASICKEGEQVNIPWSSRIHLVRLCLFDKCPYPRMIENDYGSRERTYQIYGRVHLDYLELYHKFEAEELHSYTLDNVLQVEIGQSKVAYTGTLEQLYRRDFRRFAAYNRQDVVGLNALDDKIKLIQIANSMAHMSSVTLDKALGSVVIIEQAILKRVHQKGLISIDRNDERISPLPIPGAFVHPPRPGLFEWIASYDFKSLYPNTIRALNLDSTTIVGQCRLDRTIARWNEFDAKYNNPARSWAEFAGVLEYHDIIGESSNPVTVDLEDGGEVCLTGAEWKQVLRDHQWACTGFGTIIDMTKPGIIPEFIGERFAERIRLQDELKSVKKTLLDCPPEQKKELTDRIAYLDLAQYIIKIFMNSLYGSLLNRHCRYYDYRLGASTTMSGRLIWQTLGEVVRELIADPKVLVA